MCNMTVCNQDFAYRFKGKWKNVAMLPLRFLVPEITKEALSKSHVFLIKGITSALALVEKLIMVSNTSLMV
ncbi:hypothetical protein J26TS2_36230 [Shouchella clausii]|uniref:hypothetical protein n=1 Tax=Shouchella tritolerans TaxID=2979466 RepID=UPI0007875F2D|nr:hypothetical protein [Shouchella tritolerans]GIN13756.1 hypothetical protein J26TS2_36230 [Shouchella clausii]